MDRFLRQPLRLAILAIVLAVSGMTAVPAWATTYEYDALGRVTKVTYDNGSYVIYTYDAAGNRTAVTGTKV